MKLWPKKMFGTQTLHFLMEKSPKPMTDTYIPSLPLCSEKQRWTVWALGSIFPMILGLDSKSAMAHAGPCMWKGAFCFWDLGLGNSDFPHLLWEWIGSFKCSSKTSLYSVLVTQEKTAWDDLMGTSHHLMSEPGARAPTNLMLPHHSQWQGIQSWSPMKVFLLRTTAGESQSLKTTDQPKLWKFKTIWAWWGFSVIMGESSLYFC